MKATGQTANGTPVPPDGLVQVEYAGSTNRITTPGFAYDAAGNQTRVQRADGTWQRLQYDAAGRLAKASDDAGRVLEEYVYGAGRQRLMTRSRDETSDVIHAPTYYVWSGDSVIAEYTEEKVQGSGGEVAAFGWRKDYVYLDERLLSTSTPGEAGEVVLYHHPDRLGTRLVTNGAGHAVTEQLTLPFGTALEAESTGATNRRFTSYDRSARTGLDYAVHRYYHPQLRRFLQTDPLSPAAMQLGQPQSNNAYAYCEGDPINRFDPTGLAESGLQRPFIYWGVGEGSGGSSAWGSSAELRGPGGTWGPPDRPGVDWSTYEGGVWAREGGRGASGISDASTGDAGTFEIIRPGTIEAEILDAKLGDPNCVSMPGGYLCTSGLPPDPRRQHCTNAERLWEISTRLGNASLFQRASGKPDDVWQNTQAAAEKAWARGVAELNECLY